MAGDGTGQRKVTVDDMVKAVREAGRPCTKADIAERTGVTRQTIANHADELEQDPRIESGKIGAAYAYWVPDGLRQQLEISKQFLEADHGRALKYGTPREARAYYDAIERIDDALGHAWDLDAPDIADDSHMHDLITHSRAAREEGFEAATLADERRHRRREKSAGVSLIDKLCSRLSFGGGG